MEPSGRSRFSFVLRSFSEGGEYGPIALVITDCQINQEPLIMQAITCKYYVYRSSTSKKIRASSFVKGRG
jgi:hypothetical protein